MGWPRLRRLSHLRQVRVNGGARENWPRAGLEAMAAGVPIVAQNDWGWREMIEHGVTGFLGGDDCELADYVPTNIEWATASLMNGPYLDNSRSVRCDSGGHAEE